MTIYSEYVTICHFKLLYSWKNVNITKVQAEKKVTGAPGCGLDVECILKVNLNSFSIGYSYYPDAVNILGVVLRIVR